MGSVFEVAAQCKDVAGGKCIVLILTNFKKLIISMKVLHIFGSEVSDIKSVEIKDKDANKGWCKMGDPDLLMKVRQLLLGFFQRNSNNNNNKKPLSSVSEHKG